MSTKFRTFADRLTGKDSMPNFSRGISASSNLSLKNLQKANITADVNPLKNNTTTEQCIRSDVDADFGQRRAVLGLFIVAFENAAEAITFRFRV